VDNHRHSVALHYMFYNFCRIHTDHVWSLDEICALLPKPVVKPSTIEHNQTLKVTPAMEAGIKMMLAALVKK
jgi:hypothetical protein